MKKKKDKLVEKIIDVLYELECEVVDNNYKIPVYPNLEGIALSIKNLLIKAIPEEDFTGETYGLGWNGCRDQIYENLN